jgi:hypothetical protein
MGKPAGDEAQKQANDDLFDDMIDKITADGSPWSYEEAVHIASDTWDAEGHDGPLPTDYVPLERRRHMTGGA